MLPQSSYFTLTQLNHGVFAAIVKEGTGAWGNAGIIDLGDFTLIIDTFLTPNAAKELRRAAESITASPIKYVLNTHWHVDHTMGNQIFKDTTIFSSLETYEIMKESYINDEKDAIIQAWSENLVKLMEEIELAPVPLIQEALEVEIKEVKAHLEALNETYFTLPNHVIEKRVYTLRGSQREIEFHCLGGGHSVSDTFVYLPTEK
jgi:cyclase